MSWVHIAATIGGISAPFVAAAATILGARFARKTGEESNQTADWSAFMSESRQWTEDKLSERDRRIKSLETQVNEIMVKFDELSDRYADAVSYIRYAVTHMDKHEIDFDPPPDKVHRDIWRHLP